MNLVGKIFIVVILVLCLVFMALSMAVYTAQKNWREVAMLSQNEIGASGKPLGLKWQLEQEKARNENLNNEKAALQKEYKAEQAARQQSLTRLQTELEIARRDRKSLEAGRADLEKDKRDAVAAMNATQKNLSDYRQELDRNRTALVEAHQDRDKHFGEVVRKTDEYNQAVNEKEVLRRRTLELAKDLKKADEALQWNGLDKNADYKSKMPPKVDAIVTSVLGDGLIEISLGSDAGLREGHQLEVYRSGGGQSTYVGRVKVVRIDPSKAVCKVDPNFQNSNVMENDRVVSKIE
jgi:multidrug efflux pump subunit AcrA (membrane-fusion protein)